MTGVVRRIEAAGAKYACVIGAAGTASIRCFPRLEDMTATLPACGFGILRTFNGSLCISELEVV
jgi:hypothetical protein